MSSKPKVVVAPEESHDLRCRLTAGTVEEIGVIRGATVAKADVVALGKFVMLDKAGAITRDAKQMVKKLPVFTDSKTLTTLMGAAQDAGGQLKVREDHDESLGARAGYADAFALAKNGTVTADIHLFDAYRNRAVVLETAKKTPGKLGLSIDFIPSYEIIDGKAMMRVESLEAVDLVDAGAITPDGLFLSAGVDTRARLENSRFSPTQPDPQMTPEELAAEMNKVMAPYLKGLEECKAALAKLTAPATAPDAAAMAAALKPITEQLSALTTGVAAMKKERAILGFRGPASQREQLAAGTATAEEIEKLSAVQKDYLSMVAEHATTAKCSKTDAHLFVQRNHRDLYAAHLKTKGVYDPARDRATAA